MGAFVIERPHFAIIEVKEEIMRQHAWLDFHGGYWHFLASNAHDCERKWKNRCAALSDLKSEGWIVDALQEKYPSENHEVRRHFYGYKLKRTIH
jgi:hypothetical protein